MLLFVQRSRIKSMASQNDTEQGSDLQKVVKWFCMSIPNTLYCPKSFRVPLGRPTFRANHSAPNGLRRLLLRGRHRIYCQASLPGRRVHRLAEGGPPRLEAGEHRLYKPGGKAVGKLSHVRPKMIVQTCFPELSHQDNRLWIRSSAESLGRPARHRGHARIRLPRGDLTHVRLTEFQVKIQCRS